MANRIEGRGHVGVILMRALDLTYDEAMEALEAMETVCKQKDLYITVEKGEDWVSK